MKILYVLLLLTLATCNEVRNTSKESGVDFICDDQKSEEKFFFKRMKDISHFKNVRTNKFINKNVNIGIEDKNGFHKEVLFEIDVINNYIDIANVIFRNDSLIFYDYNGDYSSLFYMNESFLTDNISFGIKGRFEKKIFDKKCNDTIYVFDYDLLYDSYRGLMDEELKEIWASRKRGILKVVYKDSIGDLWEGKYYPELEE